MSSIPVESAVESIDWACLRTSEQRAVAAHALETLLKKVIGTGTQEPGNIGEGDGAGAVLNPAEARTVADAVALCAESDPDVLNSLRQIAPEDTGHTDRIDEQHAAVHAGDAYDWLYAHSDKSDPYGLFYVRSLQRSRVKQTELDDPDNPSSQQRPLFADDNIRAPRIGPTEALAAEVPQVEELTGGSNKKSLISRVLPKISALVTGKSIQAAKT